MSVEKKGARKQDVMSQQQEEDFKKFKKAAGYGWTRTIHTRCIEKYNVDYSMSMIRFVAKKLRHNKHIENEILQLLREAKQPRTKTEFEIELEKLV